MNVVKNPVEDVFKRWKNDVANYIGENNCSMGAISTIASTPFARLIMMGNPTTRSDLEGDEVATTPSFQTESYASGVYGITDAYSIDDVSHQAMINMGFRRTYGPELIDNANDNIKRVVSRYSRIYTGMLLEE